MRVLMFGKFAERFGARFDVEVAAGDTPQSILAKLFPDDGEARSALGHPSTSYILDHAIVPQDRSVGEAQELAFLPPVSGG